jgi:RimJ/RimL family protein N-acetyltransferase
VTALLLETSRLILRQPELNDFPAHAALWSDPRMGEPQSEEQCWIDFHFDAGQWALMKLGYWSVIDKASGRYIGTAGLRYTNRAIDYDGRNMPEMGWGLAANFHGKGLGREAVQAVLGWADAQLPEPQTWCLIQPGNDISIRLARHTGYREAGRVTYREKPMLIFSRARNTP